MAEDSWGRVAEDGTVYVATAAGERPVGQWPDADPEEALAFYRRRFDDLALEVDLLERRIKAGTVAGENAKTAAKKVAASIDDAQAVGDLAGLARRVQALAPLVAEQQRRRRAERAERTEQARQEKARIADEAESIAAGADWRSGVDRLRALLDEWRKLPRLDRATDDALWHRFSSARTSYTRRRKQHFAALAAKREEAAAIKKKLASQAEELADSTDWGPTAGKFRELMRQWKAAGPAPKDAENALWARFRGAQDKFFAARDAVQAEVNAEQLDNQQRKQALLDELEKAVLPVGNPRVAREQLRGYLDRWDRIGKVPRDAMQALDARLRTVENAVKAAEAETWNRSNPEARARAQDTVEQLQQLIAELQDQADRAAARGDQLAEREYRDAAAARRAWLTEAERALSDFS